jgi:AAA domain
MADTDRAAQALHDATTPAAEFIRVHANGPNGGASPHSQLCLTPADWAARAIAPQDRLLGDLFSTTTRSQLSADTGLGKTMLALAMNFAMRLGLDFLHWSGQRQARVLIVDGEMPRELIKERLSAAESWFGVEVPIREGFYLLSHEDAEDMPPLDTPEGMRWILDFIDRLGGIDHVTFDNLASLTASCLRDDDGEAVLKDLRRALTKERIGQLWLHHTGHDTTRGYGIKAREWHLDTVMVGERLQKPATDVAFTLKFSKCRRRTPGNRTDFESVEVMLARGQWTSAIPEPAQKDRSMGRNQKLVYEAATKLLSASIKRAPLGHPAGDATVVTLDQVKGEARIMMGDPKHFASRFGEAFDGLTHSHRLAHYDGFVWLP